MNVKNFKNLSKKCADVFDFNVQSDFLSCFQNHAASKWAPPSPLRCPEFSPEAPYNMENRKLKPFSGLSSLLTANPGPAKPKPAENRQTRRQLRNPFENGENEMRRGSPSLEEFLGEIDVTRISEDFRQRNYSTLPKPKKEVIRSMDFENISFEDKSQDDFNSNNMFFDVRSNDRDRPIQKSSCDMRQELQMLVAQRKQPLFQSYSPPVPAHVEQPLSKSVMLGDIRRDAHANPFKDLSFTSEKSVGEQASSVRRRAARKSQKSQKGFAGHFLIGKSSNMKNCFYESDEESDKEAHTMASKITFSPSKTDADPLLRKSEFFDKLSKIGRSAREMQSDMNMVLSQNDSFLTQNRPSWNTPLALESPGHSTISIYRADRPKTRKACMFRTRSQRSFFSQNKEKRISNPFHTKSKNWAPAAESPFFSSKIAREPRKMSLGQMLGAFRYKEWKPCNVAQFVSGGDCERAMPGGGDVRPFSPSQHSNKQGRFWPRHLEERFADGESLCSALESLSSILSPPSKISKKSEKSLKLLKQGNQILELNRRVSEGLIHRSSRFDTESASELVSLFFDFIKNASGATCRYKETAHLKKVKTA